MPHLNAPAPAPQSRAKAGRGARSLWCVLTSVRAWARVRAQWLTAILQCVRQACAVVWQCVRLGAF
eukprot:10937642-Alexandrium_andersonii.AAC.1